MAVSASAMAAIAIRLAERGVGECVRTESEAKMQWEVERMRQR